MILLNFGFIFEFQDLVVVEVVAAAEVAVGAAVDAVVVADSEAEEVVVAAADVEEAVVAEEVSYGWCYEWCYLLDRINCDPDRQSM